MAEPKCRDLFLGTGDATAASNLGLWSASLRRERPPQEHHAGASLCLLGEGLAQRPKTRVFADSVSSYWADAEAIA